MRIPRRAGLRLKLNLVILPLVVGTMAVFVWLDYRHETAAIMAAHGMHVASAEAGRPIGPVPSNLSPRAVGRRALQIHALHAAVTIVLVMLSMNAALSAFVLKPLAGIQAGIAQMERGQWRARIDAPRDDDEVGRLLASFQSLGLTVDALVLQALNAERLATAALLAKKMAAQIEPEVERLGAAAAELQRLPDEVAQRAAETVAKAAARIVATSRGLDRVFEVRGHIGCPKTDTSGAVHANA